MGIWNDRKLIVNCLPLTESERAQFIRAAKDIPQEFVGDSTQRGSMSWTAAVPEELKAKATAVIGNIAPEECAQCPKLGVPASTNTSGLACSTPAPCSPTPPAPTDKACPNTCSP